MLVFTAHEQPIIWLYSYGLRCDAPTYIYIYIVIYLYIHNVYLYIFDKGWDKQEDKRQMSELLSGIFHSHSHWHSNSLATVLNLLCLHLSFSNGRIPDIIYPHFTYCSSLLRIGNQCLGKNLHQIQTYTCSEHTDIILYFICAEPTLRLNKKEN